MNSQQVVECARRIAGEGAAPTVANLAERLGCDATVIERVLTSDPAVPRRLSALNFVAARSDSRRTAVQRTQPTREAMHGYTTAEREGSTPAAMHGISNAERIARIIYGAADNPAEAEYRDIRPPGNMAFGGGNQGGIGSLRQ